MSDAKTSWRRFGTIKALPITVTFFAIAITAGLALSDATAPIVGLGLLIILVAYCAARESGGSDLFWMIAAPNALSMLAHDAFGTPRWLAAVLLPFVLWGAWRIDKSEGPGEASARAADGAVTPDHP